MVTAFAGAFFTIFFATGFLIILLLGILTSWVGTILIIFLIDFLPRYFELSNARIGTNTIFINIIPSPNVQCFQNLFVILKILIIIITINNGGKRIDNAHRPDIPQSLKRSIRLYTGIKIPRPGSPAFLKILHQEIIISAPSPNIIIIRTIASHPRAAQNTVLAHIIASGVMFPLIADPLSSKEKFIIFCK